MVSADHGPAVSGAHNTIVAARAGNISRLFTINIVLNIFI